MKNKKLTNREKALIALTLTGAELKAWRKKYPECLSLIGYYRHRPKNTRPRGRQASEMKQWVKAEAAKACIAWLKMMWRLSPATNRPALPVNGKRNEG